MITFSQENITVESAAVHPDGTMLFTAFINDHPDILYAYDKVSLKEDCDGGWFLEFTMSIASKKDAKVNEEGLDSIGQNLIQYLFEVTTKES
jgi:hypothetical protein